MSLNNFEHKCSRSAGRAKLCVANSFDITLRSKWVPRYDVYDDIVDLAQTYLVVEEVRAMHKKVNDHIPKDIALCNDKNWNHFRRMRVTTMPTSIHPWHVHLQLKNDSYNIFPESKLLKRLKKLIPGCQELYNLAKINVICHFLLQITDTSNKLLLWCFVKNMEKSLGRQAKLWAWFYN